MCILDPYPTSNILQIKRATARRVGSTYAPDFLGLMEVALINAWQVCLRVYECDRRACVHGDVCGCVAALMAPCHILSCISTIAAATPTCALY